MINLLMRPRQETNSFKIREYNYLELSITLLELKISILFHSNGNKITTCNKISF